MKQKLYTGTQCKNTFTLHVRTHTHKHPNYTNTTKSRGAHTPALCNEKVSLVTNYDTNSLWERIRAWPLLLPKLQSGCKWGRKKWAEPGNRETLQTCEFQHLHDKNFHLHPSIQKTTETQGTCPLSMLKLYIYSTCMYNMKLWHSVLLNLIAIKTCGLIPAFNQVIKWVL